ncbi:MAG: immune inhibitor A [Saprospiraceae bacterium]|nr:immune inhibitor A [Saprospiraceae bacterium]
MKQTLILFLFLLTQVTIVSAQQATEIYSDVQVSLRNGKTLAQVARTGVDVDHAIHYPGRYVQVVVNQKELQQLRQQGFECQVMIDDLSKHYLEHKNDPAQPRGQDCQTSTSQNNWQTPANYTYGTMGGYHTYDQMMAVLDDMHAKFPNLISARAIVSDTILTHEGRPLWYVKISDNPDQDEAEPKVLYTALHHSREPNSASQLLFYMWHLLENYTTDPAIGYLLNNEELYFVPCVNPDGYIYNETTNPEGGGFWRLNRRPNDDGTYGVDLNRNYGWEWGYDDDGSSPVPGSQTYRGPWGFSEPETRTLRDFHRKIDFTFTLNYHTRGNLLIYPWGYSDQLADSSFFKFSRFFTRENHYTTGVATETVGYNVNGTSDDWMYGETGSMAFTPEVGLPADGFWPPESKIDGYNKDNVWQNRVMALSALRFGEVEDLNGELLSSSSLNIDLAVRRWGFQDGAFTVSMTPLTSNVVSVSTSQPVVNLQQFEQKVVTFNVVPAAGVANGEIMQFLVKLDNGFYTEVDTLTKHFIAGTSMTALNDDCSNQQNWQGDWQITTESFVSAPTSMTDSPNGDYPPNVTSLCTTDALVSLPDNALNPQLRFFARWAFEEDYDYAAVQVQSSSGFFERLCGRYTEPGVISQPEGEPVFDGIQETWVEECMSLSDLIGETFQLSFELGADGFLQYDGFYFDDVRITYVNQESGVETILPLERFRLLQNQPNPASDFTTIRWNQALTQGDKDAEAILLVVNALGKTVLMQTVQVNTESSCQLDVRSMAQGVYTCFVKTASGQSAPVKVTVLR